MATKTTFCAACHGLGCYECNHTGRTFSTCDVEVWHPGGRIEIVEITSATVLADLQRMVDGYIEVVQPHLMPNFDNHLFDVIVNEEGMLIDLPINAYATGRLACQDALYGPVVVCPKGCIT